MKIVGLSLNRVAAKRKDIINLKVTPQIHQEFKVAAGLRGASMSGLIHQFMVRVIREEKDREPEAFADINRTNAPITESFIDEILDEEEKTATPEQKARIERFRRSARSKAEGNANS